MEQFLSTKFFIPQARPNLVSRPRLTEQLNTGLHQKLTLISAPAGFGKTTLVSAWAANCEIPVAWLSLDEGDKDLTHFLSYFITALQSKLADFETDALGILQTGQPPQVESILTHVLNDIAGLPNEFVLVLDDYHILDNQVIDHALTFLLNHMPPQMHLGITTREDPNLPLTTLRARGQLTEIRAADLRFTPSEAAEFLNQAMGLNLSSQDIEALERRTEGWIVGLQLAALSMRDHQDTSSFIKSFTGSHYFILDYLVEEVLNQQPEHIQSFLLKTSILDRLCGSLCDTVLADPSISGQETLKQLEQANLFLIPLDDQRHWYRYHHLFADLLRQQLIDSTHKADKDNVDISELHIRASQWYEDNGQEIEAFQHAVAAKDIDRAERLMQGNGMPLQYRGAMAQVLSWLESLPKEMLDAKPSLWVTYASALTMVGKPVDQIEEILYFTETALQNSPQNDTTRDLIGHVAAIRAMLATPQNQTEAIITHSLRALEYLAPENLSVRTTTSWTLGYAYQLKGDYAAAAQAYEEAFTISQMSGNTIISIAVKTSLGQIQEIENKLHAAAENFQQVFQLAGDPPLPAACEAHVGLARLHYEWNNLDKAQFHAQQSIKLAQQLENVDTPVSCQLVFARLKLAQGDLVGAAEIVEDTEKFIRQHNFSHRMPEVAAAQIEVLLAQGEFEQAIRLTNQFELPLSLASIHLAQGNPAQALAILEPYHQQIESAGQQNELLKVIIHEAIAHQLLGQNDLAMQYLNQALTMAQPEGHIRTFIDKGSQIVTLLSSAIHQSIRPDYSQELLSALEKQQHASQTPTTSTPTQPLIDPLSERELEILHLIAQGLSNNEIGERLFLALNTVKGHNRKIFRKLQVQRRTEAVARARELHLL